LCFTVHVDVTPKLARNGDVMRTQARNSVGTGCMTVGNPAPHPKLPRWEIDETRNAEYSAVIPVKSALLPKVV